MTHESAAGNGATPCITVRDLTMAYGSFVLMRDMTFTVKRGDVFIIMGGSGSGKSTLLRHLIGLNQPAQRQHPLPGGRTSRRRTRASGNGFSGTSGSCSRAAPCGAR